MGEYKVENKTKFITPTLMLIAGAVASITMFMKDYELYTMLWVLLIVLIIFYIIGDVVRYIYASVRPCILPQSPDLENILAKMNGQEAEDEDEVVEKGADPSDEADYSDEQEINEQENNEDSQENESYEEFGESYEDYNEEYTDENLDEM